ncbi:MAG TPA: saccharopine dehydrogenase, partial [Caldithrix abyssi]|nr:saccharopine dehydrogenase [Caldithrix abyssi]
MKQVLVLGAGFVARPLVRYLLDQPDVKVKIATRTVQKAEKLLEGHPKGEAEALNVDNQEQLERNIKESDIVISLLPWIHHLKVAKTCLKLGKNMVTTSYVKPEMKALDEEVRAKGLIFLNEIGVDPGIDHMAAMRIIDEVRQAGGTIESFYSYCGGLPALESNNNPLGYKFSWSPVGVMLAALSEGRYLKDGQEVRVPSEQLFEHYWLVDVPGAGTFEAYVNRDAFPYIELYGIEGVKSMYRGTLRNISHCESWNYFKKLGLFDREKEFDFRKVSPRRMLAKLINTSGQDIVKEIAAYLQIPEYSITIKKMEWLGLLSDELLPLETGTAFDL